MINQHQDDIKLLNWVAHDVEKFNTGISDYPCCVLSPPLDFYAIYNIVKSLPEKATIIDIGTAWGGTTRLMANHAPSAKIVSCDPFSEVGWVDEWSTKFGREYSYTSTKNYLKDLDNVMLLQGSSLEIFKDWVDDVDMVFEDGSHTYYSLKANLEFWKTFVKPRGIFVGHDYNDRFPGVVTAVDEFKETYFPSSKLYVVGNVWFFTC